MKRALRSSKNTTSPKDERDKGGGKWTSALAIVCLERGTINKHTLTYSGREGSKVQTSAVDIGTVLIAE